MRNAKREIDKLRTEIDHIHDELAKLLKRRLVLTEQIWQIKKDSELPLIDELRENNIVHQFDHTTRDANEQILLQNVLKTVLHENKKYLEDKLK